MVITSKTRWLTLLKNKINTTPDDTYTMKRAAADAPKKSHPSVGKGISKNPGRCAIPQKCTPSVTAEDRSIPGITLDMTHCSGPPTSQLTRLSNTGMVYASFF